MSDTDDEPWSGTPRRKSGTTPGADAGGVPPAMQPPLRILRPSNDVAYVRYGQPPAPSGLEQAAYIYPGSPAPPYGGAPAGHGARPEGSWGAPVGGLLGGGPGRGPVSLVVAVLLTALLPAAGHGYLGFARRAVGLLVAQAAAFIAVLWYRESALTVLWVLLLWSVIWVVSIAWALLSGWRINRAA